MVVSGIDLDIQNQPQITNPIAVIGMRGPARFFGIIAKLGAFLAPEQGFDGRVYVENPRGAQRGGHALQQVFTQPAYACSPIHPG